jgi:hypothetical protein
MEEKEIQRRRELTQEEREEENIKLGTDDN